VTAATVHIVDDDALFRSAIARLLRTHGYETTEHESADHLLDCLRSEDVGCVLLDVKMPGLSGPELQNLLVRSGNAPPIIFLTGHADIPTTVSAIKAGAEDVLTKPVAADLLLTSIGSALSRAEARNRSLQWMQCALARVKTLTPREHEVLLQVVIGRMNKQIAERLGITERTVKAHRRRVFEKLRVDTLAELVALAQRLGLVNEQEG
jgi:FixJ family two-component response regulator